MRGPRRKSLIWGLATEALLLGALLALSAACTGSGEESVSVPGRSGASKTTAAVRAERRAYDGAPPVVAHENLGSECAECHDAEGMAIDGLGFAPPSPHATTAGMSAISRCTQCHVFSVTDEVFTANSFAGLRQDLRSGARLNALAPPTLPHKDFMRENCAACHSGPAAREEIRTTHPERVRCTQCHVPVATTTAFTPG